MKSCSLSPDIITLSYMDQSVLRHQDVVMGNSPWITLVGGVRWSLGLVWWSHRWWVAGGRASRRASRWCVGGSGGSRLRGEARWRRPGWWLRLCLRLLLGLRILRRHTQINTEPSASHLLHSYPTFGFVSGDLQRRSWVQGLGCQGGRLGCSDRRGR